MKQGIQSELNDLYARSNLIVSTIPSSPEKQSARRAKLASSLEKFSTELENTSDDKEPNAILTRAKAEFWSHSQAIISNYLEQLIQRIDRVSKGTNKASIREALELLKSRLLEPIRDITNILESGPDKNYIITDCKRGLYDIILDEKTLLGFEDTSSENGWGNPKTHLVGAGIGIILGFFFYFLSTM